MLSLMVALLTNAGPPLESSLPAGAVAQLGTGRLRHGGVVRGLAFSPDGKRLASASHDHTVSVWAVPSGREVLRMPGDADATCVAWIDDRRLASGGNDGTVRIWSTDGPTAGVLVKTLSYPGDAILALALSPSRKVLAVASDDGSVHLVEVKSHETLFKLEHDRAASALAWSPDGTRLAVAGGSDKGITLWDPRDGKPVRHFGAIAPTALAWSPDGRTLAAREPGDVLRLWDPVAGKETRNWRAREGEYTGPQESSYQLAWLGTRIFAGASDGKAVAWDASGRAAFTLDAHAGRVTAVSVSGGLIATAGGDHAIRLWDTATRKPIHPERVRIPPLRGVAPGEGGTILLTTVGGAAFSWERSTGKVVAGSKPLALAVSRDGKRMATAAEGGRIFLRDANGKGLVECRAEGKGFVPVLSDDGSLVAAVSRAAMVPVWDGRTGKLRRVVPGHRGGTLVATFSTDGRMLVTGGRDRMLRFWDVDTAKERYSGRGQRADVTAVATSPDGRLLACATADGQVQVRAARGGLLLKEFAGHRGPVTGLSFLDGRTLVSAGSDARALAWDVSGLGKAAPRPPSLDVAARKALWKELLVADPAAAGAAQEKLALAGEAVLEEIRRDVKPVDAALFARLMKDLDDDEFEVREKAMAGLKAKVNAYEASLRKALAGKPSLDVHKRIEKLLAEMPDEDGEHLRGLRAVEVLEMIGTAGARKLLATLAAGEPDSELTARAKAALKRLVR